MPIELQSIVFTGDTMSENGVYLLGALEQMPGALARRYRGYRVYTPQCHIRSLDAKDEDLFLLIYYFTLRAKARLLNAHGIEEAIATYAPDVVRDASHPYHAALTELLLARAPRYVVMEEHPRPVEYNRSRWR